MKLSEIVSRDQNLSQHFERVQKKYADSQQVAYYTHPNQNQKLYIINGGLDQMGDSIFLFFGLYQDSHPDRKERLYLIILSWLQKQFKTIKSRDVRNSSIPQFTIVFYNTLCSSSAFSTFKQIVKILPLHYLDSMKGMVVVDAGFTNKFYGWIASGSLNNYLYRRTSYIDSTGDLYRYGIVSNKELRNYVPKQILEEQRTKSQGLCFQRQTLIDDEQPPTKIKLANQYNNGIKKSAYQERLQDYDLSTGKIPVLLKLLINHMIMNPQMLESPGIFRKSVSIDDLDQVDQHLSYKDYNFITKLNDPYLIGSVIVRIFKFLKTPIIPFAAYHKLVNNIQEENIDFKSIRNILSELPKINQLNLFYLLQFMKNEVVSRQQANKMTSYNIAAVLMPCLMRSQNPIMDMVHAKKCVKILEFIIVHCQELASQRGTGNELQQSRGDDPRFVSNLSSTFDQGSYRNSIKQSNRKTYI